MSKLSRPYQIALGALLVFALAWFTILKPSDAAELEPIPAAPAAVVPGAAGLGAAVDKAQGAAAASDANAAAGAKAAAASTGEPAGEPAAGAAGGAARAAGGGGAAGSEAGAASAPAALAATPKADAAPKDPSAPILRDVAEGKVAVVLFFSDVASDDRAVRRALLAADRHAGKVVVRVAPIARVADYAAITEGVDVTQAPTLLVIGRQNRARRIVGFTDTKGIDQLVSDVGGANFAARRFKGYRGKVENLCAVVGQSVVGNALDGQDLTDRLEIVRADLLDARRAVRRLDPPKRFAAFQSRFEDNLDVGVDAFDAALAAQRAGEDPVATYAGFMDRIAATDRKVRAAAKKAGIGSGC